MDLLRVAAAEAHEEAADQMLTDEVFNRTDDYLPPIDLAERTGEVVGKQGLGLPSTPKRLTDCRV